MTTTRNRPESPFAQKKGGILLIAIIFSTISLLTIGSFITLTNHELRLSNNQFYTNQSLNLAEAGLDEAMHLLNAKNDTGWTEAGADMTLSVPDIAIGRGATGRFDVLVEDWEGEPVVTSEGSVTAGSGLTTTKQVRMTLRRRSYFANGLTARCKIIFKGGNSIVQSFRSSDGNPGDLSIRRDRASVATVSVEPDIISLGNGHVWGYVFTGGQPPRMGPGGTVQGEDSEEYPIDWNRIGMDFTSTFPRALDPPGQTAEEDKPKVHLTELEAWIDEKKAEEKLPFWRDPDDYIEPGNYAIASAYDPDNPAYHEVYLGTISSSTIIGVPAGSAPEDSDPPTLSPLVVYADSINLTGGDLTIVGPVILVVSGDIKFSGGARLVIGFNRMNTEGASLLLYASSDVTVSGSGGMVNRTEIPNNLAIFGMGAEAADCSFSQEFGLGGNAKWSALVYAPNADITMNGGGSDGIMSGAVVGVNITITGGSNFWYDEDVEAFLNGFGFGMESWEEVPKLDRISFN
ncbi:MAG: hypothetical protein WD490_01280 [Opitutales bacterium]